MFGSKKKIKELQAALERTTINLKKALADKAALEDSYRALKAESGHNEIVQKAAIDNLQNALSKKEQEINKNKLIVHNTLNNPDFGRVIKALQSGRNILVTGGAGSGKSYILRQLAATIPDIRGNITSTTGISAINIDGITIHSWSGIGVNTSHTLDNYKRILTRIKNKETLSKRIKACKILAIDEISMLSGSTLSLLNSILQTIKTDGYSPFGGIQVLFFGDFAQLPPIQKEKNMATDYAFNSPVWEDLNLKYIELNKIHRQADPVFIATLRNLRFGYNNNKTVEFFQDCIVSKEQAKALANNIIRLFSTNKTVKRMNENSLAKLKEELYTFEAQNYFAKVEYDQNGNRILKYKEYATEHDYIFKDKTGNEKDKLEDGTKAPNILELKKGARVMLIRNENLDCGFANGTLGHIQDIDTNKIVFVADCGNSLTLEKREFDIPVNNDNKKTEREIVLVRKQYPIVLAYAVTIHKSQGLTFDNAIVHTASTFDSGQTYVALSRVKTKSGLKILSSFNESHIRTSPEVVNFYKNLKED